MTAFHIFTTIIIPGCTLNLGACMKMSCDRAEDIMNMIKHLRVNSIICHYSFLVIMNFKDMK